MDNSLGAGAKDSRERGSISLKTKDSERVMNSTTSQVRNQTNNNEKMMHSL